MPKIETYLVSYIDHIGTQSVIGSVYADYSAIAMDKLGKFVRERKDELHPDGDVCLMTEDGAVIS